MIFSNWIETEEGQEILSTFCRKPWEIEFEKQCLKDIADDIEWQILGMKLIKNEPTK